MSQLVQAACPGCKNLLRIPAEWLHQSMRCKHCGMVMHAKQQPTLARVASVSPPTPAHRTPPPATRKGQVTPAPAVPLAVPVAQAADGSPFAAFDPTEEETTPRGARRRRKGGSWWKGPALALAVLVIAGIVAIANWDRIVAQISSISDDEPIAQNDKNKDPIAEPPAKNLSVKKPSTTAKATPVKNKPKNNDRSKKDPPKKDPSKVDPLRSHPFPRRR